MVSFLSSYISQKNNGTYLVHIQEEIAKFRRKNHGKPLIVIDFVSAISMFIADRDEYLCGGRQTECQRKAELIFQTLKEFGADLVFFLHGPIKEEKYRTWLERTNQKYKKNQQIFNALRDETEIHYRYTGQILTSYFDIVCQIARNYGEIFISLENECAMDLACYATRNRAMAVIAADTDFLIMPGDWQIWLTYKFRLREFTTIGWNKYTLRRSLNLTQNQMPIFSILCGNDFIPLSNVKHIRQKFMDKYGFHQHGIAEYVRNEFSNGVPISESDIEKISDFIYNDDKGDYTIRELRLLVKAAIDCYDFSRHESTFIHPKWLSDHIYDTNSTIAYILYKGIPFSINQTFIDLSMKGTKPFSDLVIPMVRRQMGIVLYEKKSENLHRFIYHKPSHEEPFQRRVYTPIYPDFDVPGIEGILKNENKTEELASESNLDEDNFKFDILCWIVSPSTEQLKYENCITIVDTIYFIPSLVLNYLVKESQITIDEADVMLLAIGAAFDLPAEQAKLLPAPTKYTERSFWLAFVFTQLLYHFINSLLVSGLHKFVKNCLFDGFIFHKMYSKYLVMECEKKKELIEPYEQYRLYVK